MMLAVLSMAIGFIIGGFTFYQLGRDTMREEADREFCKLCRLCKRGDYLAQNEGVNP